MLTKVTADCLPRDLHVAPMGSAFVVYTLEYYIPWHLSDCDSTALIVFLPTVYVGSLNLTVEGGRVSLRI